MCDRHISKCDLTEMRYHSHMLHSEHLTALNNISKMITHKVNIYVQIHLRKKCIIKSVPRVCLLFNHSIIDLLSLDMH